MLRSSLGKKFLMAITGILLMGFVLMHMLGNLLIFAGPDALNNYAQGLKNLGALLWIARIGLLGVFIIHLVNAFCLRAQNKKARPTPYAYQDTIQASRASRTMVLTGLTILAFLIYHLCHFTFGLIDPATFDQLDAMGRDNVYLMVVSGFANPLIVFSYLAAMLCLGFHLNHGASSLFQTLGLNNAKWQPLTSKIGPAFAILIVLGNSAMPLACLLGFIKIG